jgi:hypothetical protein
MATAIALFSNAVLTASTNDIARSLPQLDYRQDWLAVQVSVSAVSGVNPSAKFKIQWSFDNIIWSDANPGDDIGTATAPVTAVQRFAVKAPYWRLVVTITGTNPSFTCTANAYV